MPNPAGLLMSNSEITAAFRLGHHHRPLVVLWGPPLSARNIFLLLSGVCWAMLYLTSFWVSSLQDYPLALPSGPLWDGD